MPTKTIEERLARAEAMLCVLVNRYNGHITKGDQELLNAAVAEIRADDAEGSPT
jgi:hypothetical protein